MELTKIKNKNVYEFHATEKLTEQDAKNLLKSFKTFNELNQKINILGVIEKIPMPEGLSPINEIFSLKLNATEVIEKYAILSEKNWIDNLVPIAKFFTPSISIKTFDISDREKAIEWLESKQKTSFN